MLIKMVIQKESQQWIEVGLAMQCSGEEDVRHIMENPHQSSWDSAVL